MQRVDIVDEDANGAMAGRTRRLCGSDQMQADLARAQTGIEGRSAVLESDVEADAVAVVG